MLRCRRVTALVASDEIQAASPFLRAAVWLHLRMCHHCSRYAAQLRAVGRAASGIFGTSFQPGRADLIRIEKAILRAIGVDARPPDQRGSRPPDRAGS